MQEEVKVPAPRVMRRLRTIHTKDRVEYMRMRQKQNLEASLSNKNENWMAEKLRSSGHKWRRQVIWGYRVFDFWCGKLGIAVEVDGPEHDPAYDSYRDEYNYRRSGIVVLRVENMSETDAARALEFIAGAVDWKTRRDRLGINTHTKYSRRWLVNGGDRAPTSATEKAEPPRGRFIIRKRRKLKRPGVAHIWNGSDTACRMASTGGLDVDFYRGSDDSEGLSICLLCQNAVAAAIAKKEDPK